MLLYTDGVTEARTEYGEQFGLDRHLTGRARYPAICGLLGRTTNSTIAVPAERATFQHRHPHAAVGVLGRTAVVDLAVAVTYGDPVHEVVRVIQQHVIATLRDHIGLQTVAVNVIVDDVLVDEDQ